MSSSNKTPRLGLNQWESIDIPERTDFNADNEIIDEKISAHFSDKTSHITSTERSKWNSQYYTNSYFGNGEIERTIKTNCPFKPSFGIVFAIGTATSITRFKSGLVQHHLAILTPRGCTIGASMSGYDFTVTNHATPEIDDEFATLNAVGYTYLYVLFR